MLTRYRHVLPFLYVYLSLIGLIAIINQVLLYVAHDVFPDLNPTSHLAFFQYTYTVHEIQNIFHDLQEILIGAFIGMSLGTIRNWAIALRRRAGNALWANPWVLIFLTSGLTLILIGYLGYKFWLFYGIAIQVAGASLPDVQVLPAYAVPLVAFSHMVINSLEIIIGMLIGLLSLGLSDSLKKETCIMKKNEKLSFHLSAFMSCYLPSWWLSAS